MTSLTAADELREKLRYTGPFRVSRDLAERLLAMLQPPVAADVAELENPVTFFCAYCHEEFPATADGLKEGMQHELTCPKHPLVQRVAELEAERDSLLDIDTSTGAFVRLRALLRIAESALTTALAKSARMGRKLQRVGLHLCETRKKLRKVEAERDAEREKREAAEKTLTKYRA